MKLAPLQPDRNSIWCRKDRWRHRDGRKNSPIWPHSYESPYWTSDEQRRQNSVTVTRKQLRPSPHPPCRWVSRLHSNRANTDVQPSRLHSGNKTKRKQHQCPHFSLRMMKGSRSLLLWLVSEQINPSQRKTEQQSVKFGAAAVPSSAPWHRKVRSLALC